MLTALAIVLVIGATAACSSAGEVPAGFQNVPWGTRVEQIQQLQPYAQCSPILPVNASGGDSSCYLTWTRVGEVPSEVFLQFFGQAPNDRAIGMGLYRVSFKPEKFEEMRGAFAERYGGPHVVRREELKTKGGLTAMNTVLSWEWADVVASLRLFGDRIDQSTLTVSTRAYLTEFERRSKEKRKEGAKGF